MGNEVSRSERGLSPQNSNVVPPRSPYTPRNGSPRYDQSFDSRASPLSPIASPSHRTSSRFFSLSNHKADVKKDRTIQRMDNAIRRRIRGGITYNMKLLIRGSKGTGKTSLFQRLKGELIPETYESTPQLQSATINWKYRQDLEQNVKCEVWDVVDHGFRPLKAKNGQKNEHEELPGTPRGSAAAPMIQKEAFVDASTVNVYHEAHGVIFLLDITKSETLEYVSEQLNHVPVHIPTLVLGNFRDRGAERKIFQKDIQKLLYGCQTRVESQYWRRPSELLYFECSLLNCYGLNSLHHYFGIPFLELKGTTIKQQLRLLETELTLLKQHVQATIRTQRYADYVEHIKVTGSDIRTGRRGSRLSSAFIEVTTSQEEGEKDVSVVDHEKRIETSWNEPSEVMSAMVEATNELVPSVETHDTEDVPARSHSGGMIAPSQLKIEHAEKRSSRLEEGIDSIESKRAIETVGRTEDSRRVRVVYDPSPRVRKVSMEEIMCLEDFKVPKARVGDLEHFYSDDESNGGLSDTDVVLVSENRLIKPRVQGDYHKQRFQHSDSSESDGNEVAAKQRLRKQHVHCKRSSRHTETKRQLSVTESTKSRSPHASTRAVKTKQNDRFESMPQMPESCQARPVAIDVCEDLLTRREAFINDISAANTREVCATPHNLPLPVFDCHSTCNDEKDAVYGATDSGACLSSTQGKNDENKVVALSEDPQDVGDSCEQDTLNNFVEKDRKTFNECRESNAVQTQVNHNSTSSGVGVNHTSSPDNLVIISQDKNFKKHGIEAESYDSSNGGGSDKLSTTLETQDGTAVVPQPLDSLRQNDIKNTMTRESDRATSAASALLLQDSFSLSEGPHQVTVLTKPDIEFPIGHYHKQNHIKAVNLLSSSSLQASLSLPSEVETSVTSSTSNMLLEKSSGTDENTPQYVLNSPKVNLYKGVSVCTTMNATDELETFLNESDSDLENTRLIGNTKTFTRRDHGKLKVESSEDDEKVSSRFQSYRISKKKRFERKRQQKEDLRQLHDALDIKKNTSKHVSSGIAIPDSLLRTSHVIEAITKAQEEAMRMLVSEPVLLGKKDTKLTLANQTHTYPNETDGHKYTKRKSAVGLKKKKTRR